MRASAYSLEASWTKPAWRMSGWRSTAAMASARWAAAWADSSSAAPNSSRWTARIEAAQAWMVLRQAASVVSRALCLLSRTPRAQSPPAWMSSDVVTRSAYGGAGPAGVAPGAGGGGHRSHGRRPEVTDLGPPFDRQPLQPAERDQ